MTQPTAAPPVRVEIYDQVYNLRGVDAEYIMKLAQFVDGKMRTVGEQTSTIDSCTGGAGRPEYRRRISHPEKKYDLLAGEFNRRAGQLAGALDEVLQDERRAGISHQLDKRCPYGRLHVCVSRLNEYKKSVAESDACSSDSYMCAVLFWVEGWVPSKRKYFHPDAQASCQPIPSGSTLPRCR